MPVSSYQINSTATKIQSLLSAFNPEGDYSKGTANYDLLVLGLARIVTEISVQQDKALRGLDLTDPSILNSFASSLGLERKKGSDAFGAVRITAVSPTAVSLSPSSALLAAGTALYPLDFYIGYDSSLPKPADTEDVTYIPFILNTEGTYTGIVQCRAKAPFTSVVPTGASVTGNLGPYVTKAETASSFVPDALPESDDELRLRVKTGVSAKTPAARDQIRSYLALYNVLDSYSHGRGDRHQLRDKRNAFGISSSGAVDSFVRTAVSPSVVEVDCVVKDISGARNIDIPSTYAGAYGVLQVKTPESDIQIQSTVYGFALPADKYTPDIRTADEARFSMYQTMQVVLPPETAVGKTVQASVVYMPGIESLQLELNRIENRNLFIDHLVKAAVPVFVSVELAIELPGNSTIDEAAIRKSIADVINTLPVGVHRLQASEVLNAAKAVTPPEVIIPLPIALSGFSFSPTGDVVIVHGTNALEAPPTSLSSSQNSFFVCAEADVTLSVVKV